MHQKAGVYLFFFLFLGGGVQNCFLGGDVNTAVKAGWVHPMAGVYLDGSVYFLFLFLIF